MKLLSLCSGTGALDLAVEQLLPVRTVAHVELDPAPSRILAAHWPTVPNLRDVKDVQAWAALEPDVITAGYPCTPFSHAGRRKGTGDPRHLWPSIAAGVALCRPSLLLCENVRGHLSLGFDQVLADLHRLDYDVRWTLLRAADVGAPHSRSRLWIAARAREAGGWPAPDNQPSAWLEDGAWQGGDGLFGPVAADLPGAAGCMVGGRRWDRPAPLAATDIDLLPTPRATRGGSATKTTALLPTPTSRDYKGANQSGSASCLHGALLPTPRSTDGNGAGAHGDGGLDLRTAVTLLPTPTAADSNSSGGNSPSDITLTDAVIRTDLGRHSNPRHGAPLPTPAVNDPRHALLVERSREDEFGCLVWTGWTNGAGYGRFSVGDSKFYAHRVAYELGVGPIPDGHEVDHLCQNSLCIRVEHLEAVTPEENRRRVTARRTHCKRGHEFTDENTYLIRPGARACRTCRAWQDKVQKARRRNEEMPLLPTPVTNDMGEGKTVERWDEWTAAQKADGSPRSSGSDGQVRRERPPAARRRPAPPARRQHHRPDRHEPALLRHQRGSVPLLARSRRAIGLSLPQHV